jgi:hypothetical protein
MQPTTSTTGGVALGDDYSGYVTYYTSYQNYPQGYMYARKYSYGREYRGYAKWDIDNIKEAFPQNKLSLVQIKKVSLRFNHYSGNPTSIYLYHMQYDPDSSVSTSNLYADCADGTQYYGPSSGSSASDIEIEWDMGANGVKDLQDAWDKKDFFAVGMISKSNSYYCYYPYGPKLVIEWGLPPPRVIAKLTDDAPTGFEGEPIYFDASNSINSTGTGNVGLRYEWDWENDTIFDYSSMSPLANHTWPDDYTGVMALRTNDTATGKNDTAYL